MNEKISYVEFPARNIPATKAFFSSVFGWGFTDYGGEYSAFDNARSLSDLGVRSEASGKSVQ